MKELKERILKEGLCLPGDILKVNSFLNHQVDPSLITAVGKELARRFSDTKVDKIVTVESSGIAIAFSVACALNVPMIFARQQTSAIMQEDMYSAEVTSFTKKTVKKIYILKRFLRKGEQILIIDDFLADGNAATGLCELVKQAGCKVAGIGIAIEKSYLPGADRLKEAGYRLESLARIKSLADCKVTFMED